MTGRASLAVALAAAAIGLGAAARAAEIVEAPTASPGRKLKLVVVPDAGGMAFDGRGNLYYSARTEGAVYAMPLGTTRPLPVLNQFVTPGRLVEPGDVEVAADGRALLIADGAGRVLVEPFGVTVEVLDGGAVRDDCTVRLYTDRKGIGSPVRQNRGFYVIPSVLTPDETGEGARLHVECGANLPFIRHIALGGAGPLAGQTFVTLVLE